MEILDLMQRALDRTNDPDAIFALDRGITEIERLREALFTILCNTDPHAIRHRDYDHLAKNIFDCASAALKEK